MKRRWQEEGNPRKRKSKMPITKEAFDKGDFKKRKFPKTENPVVVFLRKKKKARCPGYTCKEIAKALKTSEDSVRGFLKRAKKSRLVKHKTPYFIAK